MNTWQFSITKRRIIQLAVCLALIEVLLYGAGIATGILIGPRFPAMSKEVQLRKPTLAEASRAQKGSLAPAPAHPAAQLRPNTLPAPSGPAASEQLQSGIQLAVEVASFPDKDSALRLAGILKRDGFGPVTVGESNEDPDTPDFVRLGPFATWEDASRVAAEVDQSYDIRAHIRPLRTMAD